MGHPPDDSWTTDSLLRGDLAAVMQRILDDPTYLASRDHTGTTPLQAAIHLGNVDLVRFMLEHGADPNVEVDDDYTCLFSAIESDEPSAIQVVSALITAGADLHRTGVNGWTPLHLAAARGRLEMARVLLDAGADIDRRTVIDSETSPLMEAAFLGHPAVVRLLLERGADPLLRDNQQRTPLEIAESAAKGADPQIYQTLNALPLTIDPADMFTDSDLPPELVASLREQIADIDLAESYRRNADRLARDGDHEEVIRILNESLIARRQAPG